MSLWTGTLHQPAAGHAAAQFMEGCGEDTVALQWRAASPATPGPAGGPATLEKRAHAWRIWIGPVHRQVVARVKLFI